MHTYLSQEQQRQRFRPRIRRGSGGGQEWVREGVVLSDARGARRKGPLYTVTQRSWNQGSNTIWHRFFSPTRPRLVEDDQQADLRL
eukprot:862809-Pyramimonas_sp.AAC.1